MADEVAEDHLIGVYGVVLDQVHVPVADGDIALGIHAAEIAQLDLIAFVGGGDVDGALRVVQAVLAVVGDVLDDEGGAQGLELLQETGDLLLVHGEGLVIVIDPLLILVEGQGLVVIAPGEGLHGVGVHLQDDLVGVGDALLLLLVVHHGEGGHADHCQDAQQYVDPFSPLHSASSFSSG